MESISLDEAMVSSYAIVFKVFNFIVAILSVFCGLTELFSRFDYFFQGLFVVGLGLLIGYLEFNIPPKLFTYASSFFSFLGRGGIYMLIGVLNMHGSLTRWIISFILFSIGIVYAILEFVPSIIPPKNMQGEQGLSDDILDDII
jgi:hypothetical protein